MGKGMQQVGDFANAVGGSLGGSGSYFGGTPGGVGGWGQVGSDLSGDASSFLKSLTSSPQQGGGFSTLGNILQNVGPYAGLASAIPQAVQQYGLYNKLANPKWGQIPAQAQETIRQAVEGQMAPSVGSGAPGLVARSMADEDWRYQMAANQQYLQSLVEALHGGQQSGSFEKIIAALTGGLGGNYSTNAAGTDPAVTGTDPMTDPFAGLDPSGVAFPTGGRSIL